MDFLILNTARNCWNISSLLSSCYLQIAYELRKKEEGKKTRDDASVVQLALFGAFEKHQYYNIKDLVSITNQPIVSIYFVLFLVTKIFLLLSHIFYNLESPVNHHFASLCVI